MKKIILAMFMAVGLSACQYVSVDQAQEAVLIQKPWFFGSGGVVDTPVKTGTELVAFSTDAVKVPTDPYQYDLKIDDLMSADGVPLDFNATVSFQTTSSVEMVKRFGDQDKWFATNMQSEVLRYIRDAIGATAMGDIITGKASAKVDDAITRAVDSYIKKEKFPVVLKRFTLGKANPPEQVKNERARSASEEQRIVTEANGKRAEEERKGREVARAEADNAYNAKMGLSAEQYVQLETLKTLGTVCGDKNCTFVGSGTNILLQR